MSIEATIQHAAEGDQAAWDTIVRTYWRKVFNIAYRFVGTYEEAEDLTQEIFLKVFRSLATFDRRANFQTWLVSVSRNYCIDRYRSGRRDREVFAREVDASTLHAEAPGMNAHARVELQDRVGLLREALRGLSPPLRSAVLLRDVHELSYQEIADRLGVAEGTVKSRINRGRAELARQIEALRAKQEPRRREDTNVPPRRHEDTKGPPRRHEQPRRHEDTQGPPRRHEQPRRHEDTKGPPRRHEDTKE